MNTAWKSGRGALGPLQPLLGSWIAHADSPMGPVACTRTFARFGGKYASDLDPRAVGFEAPMPAGLACFAYWPHDGNGLYWVAEAKTKKGWSRMAQHHCRPLEAETAP